MTLIDTLDDAHCQSREKLAWECAKILNQEAKELEAGVDIIQFGEPAFNVFFDEVNDWRVATLERAIEGLKCETAVHIRSFHRVSMSPPLVSFNVMSSSGSYPTIRRAGRFAVNILSDAQVRISNQFARRGTDKWHEVQWRESPLGNPIIAGSLHWLDCEIYAEHAAGDHLIVIGEVKALNLQEAAATQPLLYYKGQYRNIAEHCEA